MGFLNVGFEIGNMYLTNEFYEKLYKRGDS